MYISICVHIPFSIFLQSGGVGTPPKKNRTPGISCFGALRTPFETVPRASQGDQKGYRRGPMEPEAATRAPKRPHESPKRPQTLTKHPKTA